MGDSLLLDGLVGMQKAGLAIAPPATGRRQTVILIQRTARRIGAARPSDSTAKETGTWVVADTGLHSPTAVTASRVETEKLAGMYH